jgi:phospholipid/cholesterol/gamma-HCH transport system substrate-binding protein
VTKMSKAWERARTEPGLGRDVGAIVGLMILGLVVAGFILSHQRVNWPWKDEHTFQADFRDSPGIAPGNGQEVRIAGVTVGRISAADVTDEGNARLTLAIDPDYKVYQDARLVLRPKTPLNDMYVEMSPGTEGAGELGGDDVIPVGQTADPVQLDEVLGHLDERTRNALSGLLGESDAALASAPQALPVGLAAATDNLETFKPVVESLQKRRQLIALLFSDLSDISAAAGQDDERTRRLVTSLATTLTTLSGRDDEVRAALNALPGVTEELGAATKSVQALTGQLDPTLRNLKEASGELPGALKDVGTVASELEDTAVRARPTVQKLRPLVADLRPFVAALRPALGDLEPISQRLDLGTRVLTSRLVDVQAFFYNTASFVSLQDANGGILRGQTSVNTSTLPLPVGDR